MERLVKEKKDKDNKNRSCLCSFHDLKSTTVPEKKIDFEVSTCSAGKVSAPT